VVDIVLFRLRIVSVRLSLPSSSESLTHPRITLGVGSSPSIHPRHIHWQLPNHLRPLPSIPLLGPPRRRRWYLWYRHLSHVQNSPRSAINRKHLHRIPCSRIEGGNYWRSILGLILRYRTPGGWSMEIGMARCLRCQGWVLTSHRHPRMLLGIRLLHLPRILRGKVCKSKELRLYPLIYGMSGIRVSLFTRWGE
jgi:hypothetical protein